MAQDAFMDWWLHQWSQSNDNVITYRCRTDSVLCNSVSKQQKGKLIRLRAWWTFAMNTDLCLNVWCDVCETTFSAHDDEFSPCRWRPPFQPRSRSSPHPGPGPAPAPDPGPTSISVLHQDSLQMCSANSALPLISTFSKVKDLDASCSFPRRRVSQPLIIMTPTPQDLQFQRLSANHCCILCPAWMSWGGI